MHHLIQTTLKFIEGHDLLAAGDSVLVAFSGGPDSVALFLVLQELSASGRLPLKLHLAHLNHCLRGEESDREEEFCRRFAEQHSAAIEVGRVDVKAAARRGQSPEQAARAVRYRFLLDAAKSLGLKCVATAHQADDVAETVLLHIIRGCGVFGLGAFAPWRPAGSLHPAIRIVRPLLSSRKQEILSFLAQRGQEFCTDSSNVDIGFVRNRIRHELIPMLQESYQGFSVRSLCTLNDAAVEVKAFLDNVLDSRWEHLCVAQRPDAVAFDADCFAALTAAERKAAIRRAVVSLSRDEGEPPLLRAVHYEQASALGRAGVGGQVSLPAGLVVRAEHGLIYFVRPEPIMHIRPRRLPLTGRIRIEEAHVSLTSEVLPGSSVSPQEVARLAGPREVYLSLDALALPLSVRGRRAGDRFHPLGAPGAKKLKDFFIDHKVPLHCRDGIPLVVTADGNIAWVVGLRIAQPFRLTGEQGRILHLRAEPDRQQEPDP